MGFLSKIFRKKGLENVQTVGWRTLIHEPFTGAWQLNKELKTEDMTSFFAVFSCVSKISSDIAKLPLLLKQQDKDGSFVTVNNKISKLLSSPNHYQSRQQFIESWVNSKLLNGNAYILKLCGLDGTVTGLYVLNPRLVKPLVDDDGSVFYELSNDKLNKQTDSSLIVPASEIIHDRWNCFYHPLVGLSPVVASLLAAGNGVVIQQSSHLFFKNNSRPTGILTVPGHITREQANDMQQRWDDAFKGSGNAKTAVLGNGMAYQAISVSATDAQLIEQLRLSAEIVCSTFKVHPFLIGFGSLPASMKVSDLNELYYSSCLQTLIEAIENLLTQTITTSEKMSIEFDLDSLIRMDNNTQMEVLKIGVGSGLVTPNEGRKKLGLKPVNGGDSPYLQQQNYSLDALAKRDAQDNPFEGGQNNVAIDA